LKEKSLPGNRYLKEKVRNQKAGLMVLTSYAMNTLSLSNASKRMFKLNKIKSAMAFVDEFS